jgi:Cdc6-like AAA superfamily ATPase
MVSKQLSWRSSNKVIVVLLLSFMFSKNIFSMDYFYKAYSAWRYPVEKKDSDSLLTENDLLLPKQATAEIVECNNSTTDYALVPEMSEEQKKNYVACGKTWQELVEVFEDTPEGMKDILTHLKKPLDPELRAALVVGPPGTGKTTATLAIPHLARWYWKFFSGPELASQYRNETKGKLAAELKKTISRKKKVVVIIDELNTLLENFNSKGHDTDTTSSFLWTFLDAQKRNQNFFFIGTMNRDDKIPDPIKHRFGGSTIRFPAIENPQKLLSIFKKVIARNPDIAFDKECDDLFFENCFSYFRKVGFDLTPRDYENIRFQITLLTGRDDQTSEVRKIKQHHVARAIYEVAMTYGQSGLGKEQLSEEEWRNFNAVQSRILEVKLNNAQSMSKTIGFSGIIPTGSLGGGMRFDMQKAQKVIENEFSSDQIALYRRVKKLKPQDNLFLTIPEDNLFSALLK